MHKRKSAPIHGFKALLDEGPGVFEAIVSVFGNVDYAGDRVLPGAFAASLDRWAAEGDPIPVIFSHQWDDLDAHVGEVLDAKELLPGDDRLAGSGLEENGGLWVKARLDVDEDFAGRLWRRLEKRRIREFSFAYDVIRERRSSDGANDLVELDIIEVGPTLKGMNPATALLSAKSRAELEAAAGMSIDELKAALDGIEGKATPSHAFIPGAEDASRCEVCGMTQTARAHLHTLSTGADGTKAVVTLTGSAEERQDAIYRAAVGALQGVEANGGIYAIYLEATFPERAVFLVEGWNDPPFEGRFYEVTVTDGEDGVEVGDPVEVVVEASVRPKARRKTLDAVIIGRDGSSPSIVKSDTVDGEEHDLETKGNPEDPERGNGEDLEASGSGSTGEAARALLDAELIELG